MLTSYPTMGPVARISVEIPGKATIMEWESCGARLAVTDGENEIGLSAFVIDRVDNPLRPYLPADSLSTGGVIMPRVVRVIMPEFPEFVTDYVYDPLNEESAISVFEHDRVISHIDDYLYGEWPISDAFISGLNGKQRVHMIAETILRGAGFLGKVGNEDSMVSYMNHGHLDGAEAGTAPMQPVRFAI